MRSGVRALKLLPIGYDAFSVFETQRAIREVIASTNNISWAIMMKNLCWFKRVYVTTVGLYEITCWDGDRPDFVGM